MQFLHSFNMFDDIALVILMATFIIGIIRGLVAQLIAVGVWLIAYAAAIFGATPLTPYFASVISSPEWAHFFAFTILLVLCLLIGTIVLFVVGWILKAMPKPIGGRILAGLLGLLNGLFLIVFLAILISMGQLNNTHWATQSKFAQWLRPAVNWVAKTAELQVPHSEQ